MPVMPQLKNDEHRVCELHIREERDGKIYAGGLAIPLNVKSKDLGGFREVIRDTAILEQMIRQSDPIAFWGHDKTKVLGRHSAGTLRFWRSIEKINGKLIDGWLYEFEVPDTSFGQDALISIQRGDVKGSSFGFLLRYDGEDKPVEWVEEENEHGEKEWIRYINRIDELFDFSPVARPAYGLDTTVALRHLESLTTKTGYIPHNVDFLTKFKARHDR